MLFDGSVIQQLDLDADPHTFEHAFQDGTGEHVLEIVLSGKLPEHTKINDQGDILEDVLANITDICIDGIYLGQVFQEQALYHHDHNGTTAPVQQSFQGVMGCNGCVRLVFESPVYQWLLEHL